MHCGASGTGKNSGGKRSARQATADDAGGAAGVFAAAAPVAAVVGAAPAVAGVAGIALVLPAGKPAGARRLHEPVAVTASATIEVSTSFTG